MTSVFDAGDKYGLNADKYCDDCFFMEPYLGAFCSGAAIGGLWVCDCASSNHFEHLLTKHHVSCEQFESKEGME